MGKKSDEMKFRLEPLDKKAFRQLSLLWDVPISQLGRQAAKEFLERHSRAGMAVAKGESLQPAENLVSHGR